MGTFTAGQYSDSTVMPVCLQGTHKVAVPGFYDQVRAMSDSDKADVAAFPFDEQAEQEALGVLGFMGEWRRLYLGTLKSLCVYVWTGEPDQVLLHSVQNKAGCCVHRPQKFPVSSVFV